MSRRSRGGRGRRPNGEGPRRERHVDATAVDPPSSAPRMVADTAEEPATERDRRPVPAPEMAPSADFTAEHVRTADVRADTTEPRAGCTAPQLRRFIKSRAYVPLHELRRRFAIDGAEDDVNAIDLDGRRVFVGLPAAEARLLGDLLRGGDVGYELSLDPRTPIVVGVYPMRPVARI